MMDLLFKVDWYRVFVPSTSVAELVVRGSLVYLMLFAVLRFHPSIIIIAFICVHLSTLREGFAYICGKNLTNDENRQFDDITHVLTIQPDTISPISIKDGNLFFQDYPKSAQDRNRRDERDDSAISAESSSNCRVTGQTARSLPYRTGNKWAYSDSWAETTAKQTSDSLESAKSVRFSYW